MSLSRILMFQYAIAQFKSHHNKCNEAPMFIKHGYPYYRAVEEATFKVF
jgi:hypothetical protein